MQVVRLDECLPNVPIHYLKLDVEGHELAVLAGAEKCLRRYRPRLAIAAITAGTTCGAFRASSGNWNSITGSLTEATPTILESVFYAY